MRKGFANCTNCSGSVKRIGPDNRTEILVCMRRGPFPVAIPQMVQTPQGPAMGANIVSMYPPVSEIDWCERHEFVKTVIDATN